MNRDVVLGLSWGSGIGFCIFILTIPALLLAPGDGKPLAFTRVMEFLLVAPCRLLGMKPFAALIFVSPVFWSIVAAIPITIALWIIRIYENTESA